ncbi:hypothetical protein LQW54_005828 [Pestalotiopsis sp. IQ-011]
MTTPNRGFDRGSGLVYNERLLPAFRRRGAPVPPEEWHRRSTRPTREEPSSSRREALKRKRHSSKLPNRSLYAMCMVKLGQNIGWVEEGIFQKVPTHILLDLVSRFITSQDAPPFQAWKVLIQRLITKEARPEDWKVPISLWRRRWHIENPTAPLSCYIHPMSSIKLDFIVHITLAEGVSCQPNQLYLLSTMQNLGVLEIIQPQDPDEAAVFPRVSDSVLREWCQASDSAPFPSLRVLRIWGRDFVTQRSLDYVTKFPALGVYDVAGRKADWPKPDAIHPHWNRFAGLFGEEIWSGKKRRDSGDIEVVLPAADYPQRVYQRITTLMQPATDHGEIDPRICVNVLKDMCMTVAVYQSIITGPEVNVTFIPAGGVPKDVGLVREGDGHALQAAVHKSKNKISNLMGFVLYSQLGKLWADRDLRTRPHDRVRVKELATVAGTLPLSYLPYAHLGLGDDAYEKGFASTPNDRSQ